MSKTPSASCRADPPTMQTDPFFIVPKAAHAAIVEKVEGTDAAYCVAVFVALRKLANDARSSDGPIALTIGQISAYAGCRYRKTANILQLLRAIDVIGITSQQIPGTNSHAPSLYTFGTAGGTLGTICLTLGTEPSSICAEIKKEQKESKESCAGPASPPAASKGKAPTLRNQLLDTLATIDGSDLAQITGSAWSGIGKAAADIRKVCPTVTADEIRRRAGNYRLLFPDASISAHAMAKHWARCDHPPAARNGAAAALCIGHGITPATFYSATRGALYAEILSMHAEGRPVNISTLAERLQPLPLFEEIGLWAGLAELTKAPPLSLALAAYCLDAVGLETRRLVISWCIALQEAAGTDPDAMPELFARLLQTQTRSTERRTWRKVVATAAERAADAIAGREPDAEKVISFGFPDLDRAFQPMRRGELIIDAARPSCGKSSLMRQTASAAALNGAHVLIESLEVSADDIADAMAATRSGVPTRDLRAAHTADQRDYLAAVRALDLENLHVFDSDRTLAAITARAKSIHATRPLDLIAIDYLGLFADCEQAGRGETKASAIGRVTKALKSLAMELDCEILLLAQLNRQSANDGNREPRLSDLRDSGDIEQDADRVIFIHRPDEDPITKIVQKDTDALDDRPRFFANIIQAKGRNVGTGIVSIYFRRDVTRFEEIKYGPKQCVPVRPRQDANNSEHRHQ